MPEDKSTEPNDDQVGQPEGSVEDRVQASLEDGQSEPEKPEDGQSEPEVKLDTYGVDVSSLPEDLAERDKHWQRAFTEKTMGYSSEAKQMREDLDKIKNNNAQLQAALQIPSVRRELEKAYGVKSQQPENSPELEGIDPDSKKILDAYMDSKLQPYAEYLQKLAREREVEKLTRERDQQNANQLDSLAKAGYPVDDPDVKTKMDEFMERNPDISAEVAFKYVCFDRGEKLGAKKQLDDITRKAGRVIQKPGYNSRSTGDVSDKGKSWEEIALDVQRK